MPIYRPTELKEFLRSVGAFPKKGLSQNFLIDGNVLQKIVDLAEISSGDFVFEIGSGPGVLTEELLQRGCTVVAIEMDSVFAEHLGRFSKENLYVYCEDVRHFDFDKAYKSFGDPAKKAKVVANIPYHLTSPILEKIITSASCISSAVLMVQEEVARRITAKSNTSDFSPLSMFVQYHSNPKYGFFVPKDCFYPAPRVGSSVIRLDLGKRFPVDDEEQFFTLVRTAFCHRRKMIRSSIKDLYDQTKIENALESIKKSKEARPEMLSCEDWMHFFEHLLGSMGK